MVRSKTSFLRHLSSSSCHAWCGANNNLGLPCNFNNSQYSSFTSSMSSGAMEQGSRRILRIAPSPVCIADYVCDKKIREKRVRYPHYTQTLCMSLYFLLGDECLYPQWLMRKLLTERIYLRGLDPSYVLLLCSVILRKVECEQWRLTIMGSVDNNFSQQTCTRQRHSKRSTEGFVCCMLCTLTT